ncbi:MAG: polysaccharide deacetylase family protein [Planctomycetes bacterium]|nr:polysaccharide deacetylase family protein [Planctomycetota bacterium]
MKTEQRVMLGVDVESDWGSGSRSGIETVLPRLLALFHECAVRATFFVVGELAAAFREQVDPGGPHEVGSHGLTHALLDRLDWDGVMREVVGSKERLESAGYEVRGFRAPFLRSPPWLATIVRDAGYGYDASEGSVYPDPRVFFSRSRRPRRQDGLLRLGVSTLRDRITPASLTYLRLYHPLGLRLFSPSAHFFSCHLHELLEARGGWQRLPSPLRRLHGRKSGQAAFRILETLLRRPGLRFVSCREFLDEAL